MNNDSPAQILDIIKAMNNVLLDKLEARKNEYGSDDTIAARIELMMRIRKCKTTILYFEEYFIKNYEDPSTLDFFYMTDSRYHHT